MTREATGEVRRSSTGAFSAVVRTWKKRETFQLPTCTTEPEAKARALLLADVAKRFRLAGVNQARGDESLRSLAAISPKFVQGALAVCEDLLGGKIPVKGAPRVPTFAEVAKQWTGGELHRLYPDHVETLTDGFLSTVKARLSKGILPLLGDRPLDEITRAECDRVMGQLPVPKGKTELSRETRRQYAALINRVLNLAELAGHVQRNPLPRGWLPKAGPKKRFPILYPLEDRAFLATTTIPLWARLYCGVLHREGPRKGEGIAFQRRDIDLDHGTVSLDENKTDHPRFWKLSPGVAEALQAWFELRGDVTPESPVFVAENGGQVDGDHLADKIRDWLREAGLTRADLYSKGPLKGQFGTHCFRRSMVTRNLSLGVNEDSVRRRTGHKSNELLNYRQAAMALAELDLGDVDPLVLCIPELSPIPGIERLLRELSGARPTVNAPGGTDADCHVNATRVVEPRGIEPLTSSMPFPAPDSERRETTENMPDREPPCSPSSPIVEGVRQQSGNPDAVEAALSEALAKAAAAGQWTTVEALSRELGARREARLAVVQLDVERARRKR